MCTVAAEMLRNKSLPASLFVSRVVYVAAQMCDLTVACYVNVVVQCSCHCRCNTGKLECLSVEAVAV